MNKHIILNGLGINLKTSVGKELADELAMDFLQSDSKVYHDLAKIFDRYWEDRIPRTMLRYYAISQLNYPTVIDRSMVDQLIFSEFQSENLIDHWLTDTWKTDHVCMDKIIELENSLPGNHYLLINKDKDMLANELNMNTFNGSLRSDLYTTVDEYLYLQDKFIELYAKYVNKYDVIELPLDCSVTDKIKFIKSRIMELYE